MTDIGELVVRIKADSSQMQQDFQTATKTVHESAGAMGEDLEKIKSLFEKVGVYLAAREIIDFAKSVFESADNIYIMAQRIGFAGDTLSALNVTLKQNGSSIDEFASSMKFMSRNIELASEGNQSLIDRFNSLGLSVTKLKALTPEQQFYEISKALAGVNDQGQFTTDLLSLMGRGAASLGPAIRKTGGDMEDFAAKEKLLGNALTQEQLDKVHEYEDQWTAFFEHLKVGIVQAMDKMDEFMKKGKEMGDNMPSFADRSDRGIDHFGNKIPGFESEDDKNKRITGFTGAQFVASGTYDMLTGKKRPKPTAKGNNDDIATGDDEEQAAEQLSPYIEKIKEEAKAAEISKEALFVKRAEIEANTKAQNDYNNDLRDSASLTADETKQIDDAAAALYDHKEALAQNKQIADQLTNSLTKIITNFKDMKSAITDLFNSIAQEIIKTNIAKPLGASITGLLPTGGDGGIFSGFGKLLGFADGGSPPVGVPSIVGENGPELFVPSSAGTVVPNHALGGSSVTIYQTFNMQPGLVETVGAAISQAAPQIAAMTHASIAQDIQTGGSLSRIVGRRS